MQKMINSDGPRIAGLEVAIGTNTTAKTNPASTRDKIKMDDSAGKKNLTPRGAIVTNEPTHFTYASVSSNTKL